MEGQNALNALLNLIVHCLATFDVHTLDQKGQQAASSRSFENFRIDVGCVSQTRVTTLGSKETTLIICFTFQMSCDPVDSARNLAGVESGLSVCAQALTVTTAPTVQGNTDRKPKIAALSGKCHTGLCVI